MLLIDVMLGFFVIEDLVQVNDHPSYQRHAARASTHLRVRSDDARPQPGKVFTLGLDRTSARTPVANPASTKVSIAHNHVLKCSTSICLIIVLIRPLAGTFHQAIGVLL